MRGVGSLEKHGTVQSFSGELAELLNSFFIIYLPSAFCFTY